MSTVNGALDYVPEEQAKLMGEAMEGVPPHKRKTNLVFQHPALFTMMNLFDNIGFGLTMKEEPRSKIKKYVTWMLEIINLTAYENKRINQTGCYNRSGGYICR